MKYHARRSWSLQSWQNSEELAETGWTHGQNERREITEKIGDKRNKEVTEKEQPQIRCEDCLTRDLEKT